MDTENILVTKESAIMVNGRMMLCMDKESKHGQTVVNLKELSKLLKNKDEENIPGQIIHITMANGKIT